MRFSQTFWLVPLSFNSMGTPGRVAVALPPTSNDPENVGRVRLVPLHFAGGVGKELSRAVVMLLTVMGTSSRFLTVKTAQRGVPG